MLPSYTFALGGTEVVKKIMAFVGSQDAVRQTIQKKMDGNRDYAIGDDSTFDLERDQLLKGVK